MAGINSRLKPRVVRGHVMRSVLQRGDMLCLQAVDDDGRRHDVGYTATELARLGKVIESLHSRQWFKVMLASEASGASDEVTS